MVVDILNNKENEMPFLKDSENNSMEIDIEHEIPLKENPSLLVQQQTESSTLDALTQLQQLTAVFNGTHPSNFPFLTQFENMSNAQQSESNSRLKQSLVDLSQLPTDILKRELMNQKVRADNRERKKRWRQQNEERNKDNDLRCRVNKRAHKLFGKDDSEHKRKWIEDEFLKRQQKRKEKERRKGFVDDSLNQKLDTDDDSGLDLNAMAQHLNPQNSLNALSDVNYLHILCNSLGIPAAARTIIDNVVQEPQETMEESKEKEMKSLQNFPFQILELLQQLQQSQPEKSETELSSNDFQLTQPNFDTEKPEDKLAALLNSVSQQTNLKEEQKEGEPKSEDQLNSEFPIDAVLTLMQLNAGWRQ